MSCNAILSTAAAALLAMALSAQTVAPSGKNRPWTPPRTADGQPDLHGIWTNATITPLERPATLSGQQVLSEAQVAALQEEAAESSVDRPPRPGDVGSYNQLWFDRGTKVVETKRSSLIVDPPDGRVPPLTAEAARRVAAARAHAAQHPADGPEDRSLPERCIIWPTAGPPMLPGPYNNNYEIFQTAGYVVIVVEMIHDARIIPLDGRPHLPQGVRQWMGDSRGHWEGNTLVVDTTNFTSKTSVRGSDEKMHLVERFTRSSPDTILYEFTVEDPSAFTRPWTAQIPMTKAAGPVFEYACHEGNYALSDILRGARAQEKASAEK